MEIEKRIDASGNEWSETKDQIICKLARPVPYTISEPAFHKTQTVEAAADVPSQDNPYSVNACIERGKNRGIIDLYTERTQPRPEQVGEVDVQTQDPDVNDMYSERMERIRKRRK